MESDQAAYAALFRVLHTPLLRYARRFVADDATAYDVLQDVFMKLWDRRSTLDPNGSIEALLYTMVRNRALNLLRREGRETNLDAMPEQQTPTSNDVEAWVDSDDLARRIRRWIQELPNRRREAFVLSRFHGLSHKEISAIMGVSLKTIDTHILLALKFLRVRLDRYQTEQL